MNNPVSRNLGLWLLLVLLGLLLWSVVNKQPPREPEVSFSRFLQAVDDGRVYDVVIKGQDLLVQAVVKLVRETGGMLMAEQVSSGNRAD